MQTNSHDTSGAGAALNFAPINYDVETIEPDAYPGEYEATIDKVQFRLTKKDAKPMIQIDWKLTGAVEDTEECQKSVGTKVSDWIVLAADKTGNRGKVKMRTLRDKLGLDADVLPTQISSFEDLKEFAEALKGASMNVWVTNSTDPDGNVRTNVNYQAAGGAGMAPLATDEEEQEEAPKARASTKTAGKAAPAKKAARR